MSEMVKRVARAIYALRNSTPEQQARAAIDALRGLPKTMTGPVSNNLDLWDHEVERIWAVMIDEALK